MDISDKKIERLILKEGDVLVVHLPNELFYRKKAAQTVQTALRKALVPRKNKILIIPETFKLSVIGEKEIKEYISQIDLWNLFDEEGELEDGNI